MADDDIDYIENLLDAPFKQQNVSLNCFNLFFKQKISS